MTNPNPNEQFSRDGFYVHQSSGIPLDLLQQARQRISHILDHEYETGAQPWGYFGDKDKELTRVTQIHMTDSALFKLITHPAIGQLAAALTGANTIKVWGCQLFYKPAGSQDQGNVGFHRDSEHMPYFKSGVLTGWLPLTAINANSGPLTVIKGSHQWQKSNQFTGGEVQDMGNQKNHIQQEQGIDHWPEEKLLMPLSGISFHDFDLLHGSYPNTSEFDRCAISLGLMTDKAQFDPTVEDYGYGLVLDDERFCPTIFQRE